MEGDEVYGRHGDGEVLRRLDAYAASRLTPSREAVRRTRAAIMIQAHWHAGMRATGAAPSVRAVQGHKAARQGARPLTRRASATLLAATVGLALAAGSVAASGPGGPLYEARLWTETLSLPSDARGRAEAQLDRLDVRLAEVRRAATSADPSAGLAALRAYEEIVLQLAATLQDDPGPDAWVVERWTRHVEILRSLVATAPAPARAALEHALDSSSATLDRFDGGTRAPIDPAATPSPGGAPDKPAAAPRRSAEPATPASREHPRPERPSRAGATTPPGQTRTSRPSDAP